jgi:hypothetical protein
VTKALFDRSWFTPISSQSIYEADYENSILHFATDLFPEFHCARFKFDVSSPHGGSQADLALVDKHYRSWIVVEVELEHHSLFHHVEPQMRRLSSGEYSHLHARSIASENPAIDLNKMINLISTVEPRFLVIVPTASAEWRSVLSNIGVDLCEIRLCRDSRDRRLLLMTGDPPSPPNLVHLTFMVRDTFLPRAFRLEHAEAFSGESLVSMLYGGLVTSWRIVRTQRQTVILPDGTLSLNDLDRYEISRRDDGQYMIGEPK